MEKLFKATHTIDNVNYHIFDKQVKGGVWMLHFIWGKKDFRIYLGRKGEAQPLLEHAEVLASEEAGELVVTRLQYLNFFEWYDYEGVVGHGLDKEETRWRKAKKIRYPELPKGFYEHAVDLACREFGLQAQHAKLAS